MKRDSRPSWQAARYYKQRLPRSQRQSLRGAERAPRPEFILHPDNPDTPLLILSRAHDCVAAAAAQLKAQGSLDSSAIVLVEEHDRLGMSLWMAADDSYVIMTIPARRGPQARFQLHQFPLGELIGYISRLHPKVAQSMRSLPKSPWPVAHVVLLAIDQAWCVLVPLHKLLE